MKVRKTLLVAAAGCAGLAARANAQLPVPPVAAPVGAPAAATTPPPTTIWQKLGLSKDQKEECKRKLCATPLGQLINNAKAPLTALSGGLIPPFCPTTPSAAQLADPGAEGAAAAIMLDEAGAKARRAAVRYLGTVDCHYWPEAEDALVAALRGDRNECVRWEAALALGRGCCCTKKTIEALTIVVSCSDRDGAPKETSHRVHAAAAAALDHCLECYASVATAPVGEKPIERTTPPVETIPPPAPETSAAKPINPGAAKPAAGLTPVTPPPAVVKRPVGPEYYAHVAKAPLAAVLAEARRVAEKRHSTPIVADTPFQSQGHSIAALMSYATGPDTQAVIPAGMSVPAGEVRAEVVSAKPANLWDLLSKPGDEGQAMTGRTEMVVVQPPPTPKPVVVKREVVVVKPEIVVKRDAVVPKPEALAIRSQPMAKPMPPAPDQMLTPMPKWKQEPLTLDFPPPVVEKPLPPLPEEMHPGMSQPAGPSPYYATATTPTITNLPSEPAAPMVSTYHPTATTQHASVPMPMDTPAGPSPYYATAATPTITNRPTESFTQPAGPSPYFATAATPTIANQPSGPDTSAVSSYHATAATAQPATPKSVVKNTPTPSPYNSALPAAPAKPATVVKTPPAQLPAPAALPAMPLSTKPMPAPAAPVVPAATVPAPAPAAIPAMSANGEIVEHLLQTAKGNGPVEVRKASIQELAKMKANTPEVMVALDGLSDDPTPAVRAEAIIAAARLRMGR